MQPKIGLVLTGGGARAAYQVGVLRALANFVPTGAPSPFQIVCGTSAGAINATAIAAGAADFRRAVCRLLNIWTNFRAGHIYRADVRGIAACGARWLSAVLLGGIGKHNSVSLLDNSPLAALLSQVTFADIKRSIDAGHLTALAITASSYGSGQSITFYQGASSLKDWKHARRVGVRAELGVQHLMASAAIPFFFPPVAIDDKYYGDGSTCQIAPISPSLHLGADRVLVVSVSRPPTGAASPAQREERPPSLAQIAGHALNSNSIDALDADLERLDRINRTVARIPMSADSPFRHLKHVDYLLLSPSQEFDQIAQRYVRELPWPVRAFLRGIGAMRRTGSNLASYVLFEKGFCRALIQLGYQDTIARHDEVRAFLGIGANTAAAEPTSAPLVHKEDAPERIAA
jgi:NTE family protein